MPPARQSLARIIPNLAAVAFTALFVALGFWQLGRAEFKRELLIDFQGAAARQPQRVEAPGELAGLERYAPVEIAGRYDGGRQIFLDNRVRDGRIGVEVFTPLLTGGGALLVNRGWLPMSPDRASLPVAPAPSGELTVRGRVSPPPAVGLELGDARPPERWPWLTPYLRLEEAESALGRDLAGRVILLGANEPHGFIREWEPATMFPERHVGYAVQWFALAAAVVIVWLALTLRARKRKISPPRTGSTGNH